MSAILSADDLNDFISPGVACIKPVETLPAAPPPQSANEHDEFEVTIHGQQPGATTNEHEIILDGQRPVRNTKEPAQVNLTDCLACSGCVTSAEAVLISLQSHAEVLSMLDAAPALKVVGPDTGGQFRVEGLENKDAKLFVASVSPQTRASLAAACGNRVSEAEAGRMLTNLLSGSAGLPGGGEWKNGFAWVVDTNAAREASLVLSADEVLQSSVPGAAAPTKPILAASCPGWVCYAEKTHPHVLPHLSKVKSPQALTGSLLKSTLSRKLGIATSRIWHLAVMPCFDKKLEASRKELTDEVWAGSGQPDREVARDVDCVITSKEVLMLAESRNLSFFDIPGTVASDLFPAPFPDARLHSFLFPSHRKQTSLRQAGSSGGLLYHVLQTKAAQIPGSEIHISRGRNVDVMEYSITLKGEPVFKAARYYGFRNIQNLVRRLKPAKPRMPGGKPFGSARKPAGKSESLDYGYVEVMACPGGCTNGGGQIKIDDPIVVQRRNLPGKPGPQEQKEWLAEVDEAYFSGEEKDVEEKEESCDVIGGISHSYIHDTLAYWSDVTGIGLDKLAFTTYREVISDVGKKTTDAEKVVQLAGKIGGGW